MKHPLVQSVVQRARFLNLSPEFISHLAGLAEKVARDLQQLAKAAERGDRRRMRAMQDRIFRSHAARLVCLVLAVDPDPALTPEWLETTAASLDLDQPCGEKVYAWAEPKSSGEGWRPMCKFGPIRTAKHILLAKVLEAKFNPDPNDYMAKGRGAEAAADRMRALLEDDYLNFFVIGDIQDFFRSVQQRVLARTLGLPAKVVSHSLVIGPDIPLSIPPSTTHHEALDEAVRQGLPQGSRASQLVAGLLLGPTLRSLTSTDSHRDLRGRLCDRRRQRGGGTCVEQGPA